MTPTTRRRVPRHARIRTVPSIALAACVPLLGACGGGGGAADDTTSATPPAPHSPAPASSSPAPSPSPTDKLAGPGERCGTVTLSGDRFRLTVRKGRVDCGAARSTFKTYLVKLRSGAAPGNGGGGPVHVHGWTCVSGTAVHPGSSCTKSTASFAAKPL